MVVIVNITCVPISKRKYQRTNNIFIGNNLYLQYAHDIDEEISWGNSIYQEHDFTNNKRLNYGIFVGGYLDNKKIRY